MAVYRRSNRHRYVLLLLVLTSVTVITLDYRGGGSGVLEDVRGAARDAWKPVRSTADDVFTPVGDFFSGVFHYHDLKAENRRLRRQIDAARGDRLQADDARRENEELLKLNKLDFVGSIPTVAARVISTTPSNFQLTVEIDRGTGAGLDKGMPVVTGAGLVGRVVEASRTRATVLLITDLGSNVGIRLTGTGDVGVAKGEGTGSPLSVDLIDLGTHVSIDEPVVTSGLQQSIFPPGVPVGRVRTAAADPGALQQVVTLDPVVDFRRLEFVSVLLWRPA